MARKLDFKESFDVFSGEICCGLGRKGGFFSDKSSDGFDVLRLVFDETPNRRAVTFGVAFVKRGGDEERRIGFEENFFDGGKRNAGVGREAIDANIETAIKAAF